MDIAKNIIYDRELQNQIDANALGISGHVLLALANVAAGLFPDFKVYIGAQQQGVKPPALFVDFYSMSNQKRLADTSVYEFGFEITYIPKDEKSSAELSRAVFLLEQNLETVTSDTGNFQCYEKGSDFTDRLAHVTGIITAWEKTVPDDSDGPVIQHAEKELKL